MRALVSVSDKSGLVEFVQGLVNLGWEIIATGGTRKLLEAEGVTFKNNGHVDMQRHQWIL